MILYQFAGTHKFLVFSGGARALPSGGGGAGGGGFSACRRSWDRFFLTRFHGGLPALPQAVPYAGRAGRKSAENMFLTETSGGQGRLLLLVSLLLFYFPTPQGKIHRFAREMGLPLDVSSGWEGERGYKRGTQQIFEVPVF